MDRKKKKKVPVENCREVRVQERLLTGGGAGAQRREAEGACHGDGKAGRRPLELKEGGGVGGDTVVVGGAGEVAESSHCFGAPSLRSVRPR